MSKANAIFILDGINIIIQCTKEEKMKNICQRYSTKIQKNINSLIFMYGGNKLNLESNFYSIANSIDKGNNEVKILVYKIDNNNECLCPKCGEKIILNKEKIDDIILSNNNIKEAINGVKIMLDNINNVFNKINEDIKQQNIMLKQIEHVKKLRDDIYNMLIQKNNIPVNQIPKVINDIRGASLNLPQRAPIQLKKYKSYISEYEKKKGRTIEDSDINELEIYFQKNAIRNYAGTADIKETLKYLKYKYIPDK